MIPIVENLLTEIIESRLKYIKTNTDIVDRIFSQATVTMRSRLKEYISQGSIKVLRGFPNDRAVLPCYAIMLGGEREQEKTLGMTLDDDFEYEVSSTTETINVFLKDSKRVIRVTNKPIEVINYVTDEIGNQIGFELINERLGLIEILDDNIESVNVNYVYRIGGRDEYGSFFNTQYRVETWTNNGDLTVMLYHLLKWILLSSRDYLDERGLTVQTLGGLDFEPAPEYFPEFVYRRALTFECITENSFGLDFDGFIQGIDLKENLEGGE